MSKSTVVIDGETYTKESPNSNHVIVIVPNGWIFIGCKNEERSSDTQIVLASASVVRKWSNGRGIGGLCKEKYKDEYTLDYAGTITIPFGSINAILHCSY